MTTETTYEMALTRVFDAPVEDVWRAWTEPAQVRRWWGPTGFTCPVAEMDVRGGGTSLVCMRAPAEFGGADFYNTWTYSTVLPMERLDFVQHFTDDRRNPLDPADLGLPAGIPRAVPHTLTFTPLDDHRTELALTESGYASEEVVATSRAGMEQVLDKLAAMFAGGEGGAR